MWRQFDDIERQGEEFGDTIADAVIRMSMHAMTVASVDDDFAYCYIYEDDDPIPVSLSFLGSEDATLKVTPSVGSTVAVAFLNGNNITPILVGVEQVDKVSFTRSKTAISVSVDPEDDTKDVASMSVGDSSVTMTQDLIEMNGGKLGGLVVVGDLTSRLNRLQSEINQIQSAIASHSHMYIDSKGAAATPTPSQTTSTMYSRVQLTEVKDEDYVNKKITQ